ncbi:MAG: YkgJ family cysteine cluster protein [Acidobacteria bacterium]|nr:YkgJ family cysteine cluster protein [Acidobacteriota bacterium]
MGERVLPVLNFAPFRKYPTKQDKQEYSNDLQVCNDCISGACCANDYPIHLSNFDVLRLAVFFNMTPAEFMLNFTQDRFDGKDGNVLRPLIDDPDCSVVTYLRRRANSLKSPCIFHKYIRESDGTPRRVCSVHEGRPLACREFYYDACKLRGTVESASVFAEGFEKVRDGEVTEAMTDAELARLGTHDFGTAPLASSMEYSFWVEMKRVIKMEEANIEGANSYDIADFQDPIDEKLNRLLSKKNLRFEETFGPIPHDEQLMPYTAGMSFVNSPEYQRILTMLRTPPSTGLYALGDYPHDIGIRAMIPGVKHAEVFSVIPDTEIKAFLDGIPSVWLFPTHDSSEVRSIALHDVYASVLKGYNHLIRLASHIVAIDGILEYEVPGLFEFEMLSIIADFETSLNPYIALNPYIQPVKNHMAQVTLKIMENEFASATSSKELFGILKSLRVVQMVAQTLTPEFRARVNGIIETIEEKLRKDNLDLYVAHDNPVRARWIAGKRLNAKGAWNTWSDQAMGMRHAAIAGFKGIDLPKFYRQSVEILESLPLRKSYGKDLYNIVKNLARSMTLYNRIPYQQMTYRDSADRLAAYGLRLFNWAEETGGSNRDCKIIAEFAAAVYKGLGLSYSQDPSLGLVVHRLLSSQLPDGSWETNPLPADAPERQADYLYMMYRATGAAINGLCPKRFDVLNPDNTKLGLA